MHSLDFLNMGEYRLMYFGETEEYCRGITRKVEERRNNPIIDIDVLRRVLVRSYER